MKQWQQHLGAYSQMQPNLANGAERGQHPEFREHEYPRLPGGNDSSAAQTAMMKLVSFVEADQGYGTCKIELAPK